MKNEHYTPPEYIQAVKNVLGYIGLDPFSCEYANRHFVKAIKYYSKEDSAFDKDWAFNTLFMNPPYSNGEYPPAIEKFLNEFEKYHFDAITLTNNNTDTAATQKLMKAATAYCFPEKRINYYTEEGKTKGNRFGQLFCYFGSDVKKFREEFEKFGNISLNLARL
jgi:hypothetical protein